MLFCEWSKRHLIVWGEVRIRQSWFVEARLGSQSAHSLPGPLDQLAKPRLEGPYSLTEWCSLPVETWGQERPHRLCLLWLIFSLIGIKTVCHLGLLQILILKQSKLGSNSHSSVICTLHWDRGPMTSLPKVSFSCWNTEVTGTRASVWRLKCHVSHTHVESTLDPRSQCGDGEMSCVTYTRGVYTGSQETSESFSFLFLLPILPYIRLS